MATDNTLVELRNDSAGTITLGTLSIAAAASAAIWDTQGFQDEAADNFQETLDDPATFNEEVGNGNLVMVQDGGDLTSAQAFALYHELRTAYASDGIATSGFSALAPKEPQLWGAAAGVITGGVLSINGGDASTFDISDGYGYIVDYWTTPGSIQMTKVTLGGTGITVTNLATNPVSYILVNSSGTVVQLTTPPTPSQIRANLYLGQLGHANNTTIATAVVTPLLAALPSHNIWDMSDAIGTVNDGITLQPNGANLNLDRVGGTLFRVGANVGSNAQDPNNVTLSSVTTLSFRLRTQTGNGATGVTTLDVNNYDNGGTITAMPTNDFQNFRAYQIPSGNVVIQYGQNTYNKLSTAIDAIPNESFVQLDNLKGTATLIALITVQEGATDLSDDTQARFFTVSKFGESISSVSATGTGIVDHGLLVGLTEDHHAQYLLVDGTRAMSGDLDMDQNNVVDTATISLGTGPASTGAVRLSNTGAVYWNDSGTNRRALIGAGSALTVGQDAGVDATLSINYEATNTHNWVLNGSTPLTLNSTALTVTTDLRLGGGAERLIWNDSGTNRRLIQGTAGVMYVGQDSGAEAVTTVSIEASTNVDWVLDDGGSTTVMSLTASGLDLEERALLAQRRTIVTPTAIGATANNYDPTGFGTCDILKVSATGAQTITGFAAPVAGENDTHIIYNDDPSEAITISHEDAGSTDTNRVLCPGGASYSLSAGEAVTITYDSNRWRVVAFSSLAFTDDVFRVQDNLDNTKQLAFEVSGLTTATTRTITVPDEDITIDGVNDPRDPNPHHVTHVRSAVPVVLVQETTLQSDTNTTSLNFNLPSNITAGNTVVVHVTYFNDATAVTVTAGGDSTTEELDVEHSSNVGTQIHVVASATGGSSAISITSGASIWIHAVAQEWSGLDTSNLVDQAVTGSETTSPTPATVTTAALGQSSVLAFAAISNNTTESPSQFDPPDGFTLTPLNIQDWSNSSAGAVAYKTIEGDASAITTTWGDPGNRNYGTAGVLVLNAAEDSSPTDLLDGDRLDVSFTPTNYTPTSAPSEVGTTTELTSHLAGIDTALGLGGDVVGPVSATDNALARFDETTGKLIQGSLASVDDLGYLSSNRYLLGADLSLIPISGGQSVVTTWHGMQLVGNKQSTVNYTPTNVGAINQFGVLVPSQDIDADASFAVIGAASQTGDLVRYLDNSLNVLGRHTIEGNFLSSTDGSTTGSPRIIGFENFTTGEAYRLQLTDYEGWQSQFGGSNTLYCFHTMVLRGNRNALDTPAFDADLGIGVLVQGEQVADPSFVIRGANAQTADLFQIRDTVSGDTNVLAVDDEGNMIFGPTASAAASGDLRLPNLWNAFWNNGSGTDRRLFSASGDNLFIGQDTGTGTVTTVDIEAGTSTTFSINGTTTATMGATQFDLNTVDLDMNNNSIVGVDYATFNDEGNFGNSGATPSISFTTLGQKARITLNANATFSFTFPGVGNYILRIIQDATGSRTVTLPSTARAAGGSVNLAGSANAITVWAIYHDGTNQYISSMPDVGTSAPTVNLT